jgi:hypothetical protein
MHIGVLLFGVLLVSCCVWEEQILEGAGMGLGLEIYRPNLISAFAKLYSARRNT